MKKHIIAITTLFLFSLLQSSYILESDNKSKFKLDTSKSLVKWTGFKVLGKHEGTIAIKNGNLNFKNGKFNGGDFEIDMKTINNTDLEGEWKNKLENHLKSDDFFGAEKYPVSTLVINSVSTTNQEDKVRITGKITIKSTTKPIEFYANLNVSKAVVEINSKLIINRADFDVRYGSDSFFSNLGDKAIKDEFELDVKIVANKI
jgi:polyisoprenoid-binding protein YceI